MRGVAGIRRAGDRMVAASWTKVLQGRLLFLANKNEMIYEDCSKGSIVDAASHLPTSPCL